MKKRLVLLAAVITFIFAGCGNKNVDTQTEIATEKHVADKSDMASEEEVGFEGMEEITGDELVDGVYSITVDSSSKMFKIVECELTVANGEMTAKMIMSGTGYKYLYMGAGEEADKADESEYIPFEETDGVHSFTVPVAALNKTIDCTAFSARKEMWYDRTLVFRADNLPVEAYKNGAITSVSSLSLEDGNYTVEVALSGGSGKTTIDSPTTLIIKDGKASALIRFSSPNYDYMIVDGVKYENETTVEGENSTFTIPVAGFDFEMGVVADTTAMSKPHEISYTLNFNSSSITKVN